MFGQTVALREDVYDSRGYTVRKDWVNGPNKVFSAQVASSAITGMPDTDGRKDRL